MPPKATDHTGKPVPVNVTQHDVTATPNSPDAGGSDAPSIRVRAKVDFFTQGELKRAGEEFEMDTTRARNAAQMIEVVDGGSVAEAIRKIGGEGSDVPRADIAGRPTHERIGALEEERDALQARLGAVDQQLEQERARQQRHDAAKVNASPAPTTVDAVRTEEGSTK